MLSQAQTDSTISAH